MTREQVIREIADEALQRGLAGVVITASANPQSRSRLRPCLFLHVPAVGEPYEASEDGSSILRTLREEAPLPDRKKRRPPISAQLCLDLWDR